MAWTARGFWHTTAWQECRGGKAGAVAAGGVPVQNSTDVIGSSKAVLGSSELVGDDGLNSAKWEWPLIVDLGDKSSHRSRVLRAAICETVENQAASIIRCTLRTNSLRQFFSLPLEKLADFPFLTGQPRPRPRCEKTLPMLMVRQEQFLITLFNFHGNAGNLKPAQDQFSRLKSVHHSLWAAGSYYTITSCFNHIRRDCSETAEAWITHKVYKEVPFHLEKYFSQQPYWKSP